VPIFGHGGERCDLVVGDAPILQNTIQDLEICEGGILGIPTNEAIAKMMLNAEAMSRAAKSLTTNGTSPAKSDTPHTSTNATTKRKLLRRET
jgi:hypothetical protein